MRFAFSPLYPLPVSGEIHPVPVGHIGNEPILYI